jgi:hypothetical protein
VSGDGRDTADTAAPKIGALGGETVYEGRLVEVRVERFRHSDGRR